jgi:biopolymer transport protein ExbB
VSGEGTDCCPNDASKTAPGACGCGVADVDSDLDGTADCDDTAPYGWRRRLTFDRTQVGGTLMNFPVLVRLTDAHLGTSAAVSGNDIYFVAGDETTLLAYEIESFDASMGMLVAWVNVSTLDPSSDPVIYIGYGDGQSSRSNAGALWSGHHYVWHLAQDPSGSGADGVRDSTGRANGTSQGGMTSASSVAGVVGKAIAFDGVDDRISFMNDITGSGPSTMEAWVNQSPQSSGLGSAIITLGNQATNAARFFFTLERSSGKSKVGFYNNDLLPLTLATGVWTHFVWVWDGSMTRIYVNGALAFGPSSHTAANTAGTAGNIGNSTFTSPIYDFYMLGQLDEVRVSTVTRPAAWIATEFNNQRMGATFMKTIDPPVAAPEH